MIRSIATAAVITLSLSAAAQAGEVRFGDLNLASPRDSAVLKSRIAEAAATTCAVQLDFGVSSSKIIEARKDEKACIARVSAATLAKVQTLAAQAPATRLARQ